MQIIRYVVFAVFLAGAVVAFAGWAVRTKTVNPFSGFGRMLRSLSEPFIKPMERWLVKNGHNPQSAPLWIFGVTLVGSILVIATAGWLIREMRFASGSVTSGRGVFRLLVYYAGNLILAALLVRVVASWFGQFRYAKWMRPVYLLTDWFIKPLQKVIPPIGGMIDITPLIAWFGIKILLGLVMRML